MKVLVLSNGKLIKKEINNGLEALQNEVEGYIEIPFISNKFDANCVDVIINEEGKLVDGLRPEIIFVHNGKIEDVTFGNVVFASHDDEGNTIGLTEDQMNFVQNELKVESIIRYKNNFEVVRTICL